MKGAAAYLMAIHVENGRVYYWGGIMRCVVGSYGRTRSQQHMTVSAVFPHENLHWNALGSIHHCDFMLLNLLPLRLIPTVLEPNFHLGLSQPKVFRQVGALRAGQISLLSEAPLQLKNLSVTECGAWSLLPFHRRIVFSHEWRRSAMCWLVRGHRMRWGRRRRWVTICVKRKQNITSYNGSSRWQAIFEYSKLFSSFSNLQNAISVCDATCTVVARFVLFPPIHNFHWNSRLFLLSSNESNHFIFTWIIIRSAHI